MNVKRYYVKDMQEAMDKIRTELGSDAIVLSQKQVRKKGLAGFFSPKVLEVIAAYDPEPRIVLPKVEKSKLSPQIPLPSTAMGGGDAAKTLVGLAQAAQQYAREGGKALSENEALDDIEEAIEPVPRAAKNSAKPGAKGGAKAAAQGGEQAGAQNIVQGNAQGGEQSAGQDEIAVRLDGLTNMIENLAGRMNGLQFGKQSFEPEVANLYSRLLEQEVTEEIAGTLAGETQKLMEKNDAAADAVMRELLLQCMGEPSPLRIKPFKRTVVIMLGPTGVGKTTSLIKLAVYYQMKHDLKVGLINADTFRVAANEQLRIYADILGAPLTVIYSPDEIEAALEEHEDKDLVFIDTAGKPPDDVRHKKEIEDYIEKSGADEVYLVMSGSTGCKACRHIIDNYDFVKDYKLLITKMDEAVSQGIVLNACSISGRPLSYIASGQNVPNDIALADPQQIAQQLLQ